MEQLSNPSFYNGANLLAIGSHNPWLDKTGGELYAPYSRLGEISLLNRSFDGFHPLVIRIKMRELVEQNLSKYVIATINCSVIDHFNFESADHVRKSLFLLQDDHFFGLNEDEAYRFYRAYEFGIQHVSEILLTSNLWR